MYNEIIYNIISYLRICLFVPLVGLYEKEMTARVPERRKYLSMRQKLNEGWR